MFGNIGGLVSTWAFPKTDGPNYPIGNGLNLAAAATIFIIGTLTLLWMRRENRRRARLSVEDELAGLSPKQIEDLDWRGPEFRWVA
jgi:hypothetical protein